MADEELMKIRQQRLAQLQAAHGAEGGAGAAGPGSGGDNDKQKQQQQQKERDAEMRNNILSAFLTQEARARLSTLGVAKPEKAKMVENIIIQNARMGRIQGKVSEENLKSLLERVITETKKETKVSYERRRIFDDDDGDEDD